MGTRKTRSLLLYALPILLALTSLGCGLSGLLGSNSAEQIEPIPTRTPMPTFTPTPANVAVAGVLGEGASQNAGNIAAEDGQPTGSQVIKLEPTETPTLVVAPTDTPAPEPTATEEPSEPMVTVSQNMNVRGGPGTAYPVVGAGRAGDTSKIVGQNSDGSWVQVEYPSSDGKGWVYAPLVQISGQLEAVPIVDVAPPPPPPAPPPAPEPEESEESDEPPPPPEPQYQFTPTGWHASGNPGIVHFKGRIRDEFGNLINGYSVLVDNWSWSVISHPSGASHHYPEKGDGEWDVVIPTEVLGGGVGWWWLTVIRYDCPDFFHRFDAQCKQFTRLSEDVKIMVNWPDETVINADWVCHWDCDKGLYQEGFKR